MTDPSDQEQALREARAELEAILDDDLSRVRETIRVEVTRVLREGIDALLYAGEAREVKRKEAIRFWSHVRGVLGAPDA
jgi:predicted nucleotidyltransferase